MLISSLLQAGNSYPVNKTAATQGISAYDDVSNTDETQNDKLAVMVEKYKDVYTPMPETYSATDEKIQQKKIYEAYPDYISGQDFLKKYFDPAYEALGGEPLKLGTKPTQEQIEKQKMASEMALEQVGGKEYFEQMQRDVAQIKKDYPVNEWAKGGVSNAKELTRFKNAAIYEGLEKGQSPGEAQQNATALMNQYMDTSSLNDYFFERSGMKAYVERTYGGVVEDGQDEPLPVTYGPHSSVWDLRAYGIEGRWQDNAVYHNDNAMIAEIEKKIKEFIFIVNNKALIEREVNTKDVDYRGNVDMHLERIKNGYIPQAQTALDIFKDYQIYDAVDVKA